MDDQYYLKSDLSDRGWRASMIRSWLGGPDFVQDRYGGGQYYLFLKRRVQKAESKREWKAEREKWDVRGARESRPQQIDLLAAIFAVNRSAKRYRNTKCYAGRNHSFATRAKEQKELLYELKDR